MLVTLWDQRVNTDELHMVLQREVVLGISSIHSFE